MYHLIVSSQIPVQLAMEDVKAELETVQQELRGVREKLAAKRQEWLQWENLLGPLTGPADEEVLSNFNRTMEEKEVLVTQYSKLLARRSELWFGTEGTRHASESIATSYSKPVD